MHKPSEKHAKNRYDYENGFYWKLFFCKSNITEEWNGYYNRFRLPIYNRKYIDLAKPKSGAHASLFSSPSL